MFQLLDLANDKVPGYFYKEELTKSKPFNSETDYFTVEKILKTKLVKGEKLCYVKYLFYGSKVNTRKAFT